ncbi:unnamed protein product [Plutella xylostella]|uniref:(diamondback moth) hypothetical protein n=1 Tax=Plutella xylostella TaxID=51655 RepID=A0A8S4F625_PLUXY|nr:unnamed protein product [Plutella xylostella]
MSIIYALTALSWSSYWAVYFPAGWYLSLSCLHSAGLWLMRCAITFLTAGFCLSVHLAQLFSRASLM